jgi:hypothetical protein
MIDVLIVIVLAVGALSKESSRHSLAGQRSHRNHSQTIDSQLDSDDGKGKM